MPGHPLGTDTSSALHASIGQGNDSLVEVGVDEVAILRANLPAHGPALARLGIQLDVEQAVFVQTALISRCAPGHIHADKQHDEKSGQRPPDQTPSIAISPAISINA